MDCLSLFIAGRPTPQGSMRAVRVGRGDRGKIVLVSDNPNLAAWRATITEAIRGKASFDGPVTVNLIFRLPKPKTNRNQLPSSRPDLDKLIRAVLDGLTDGGLWPDDGRVTSITASKLWATESLEPGVWLLVCATQTEALAA